MTDESALPGSQPWRLGPDDPVGAGMKPPSRPCPFCGSSDLFYFEHTYSKDFAIACRACGAQGPKRRSPRKARQLWDARGSG